MLLWRKGPRSASTDPCVTASPLLLEVAPSKVVGSAPCLSRSEQPPPLLEEGGHRRAESGQMANGRGVDGGPEQRFDSGRYGGRRGGDSCGDGDSRAPGHTCFFFT
jgi:hypothetical protein